MARNGVDSMQRAAQFVKANRTQLQWVPFTFLDGIGAQHNALAELTVLNAKQVETFVNHHATTLREQMLLFLRR